MNINLQITHKETRPVDIKLPAFWKDSKSLCTKYRAVLDEKTYVTFFSSGDRVHIINDNPSDNIDQIAEAYSEWTLVDESEFMAMYDDAWESIRMRPQLIDTGREEAVKDLQLTQSL